MADPKFVMGTAVLARLTVRDVDALTASALLLAPECWWCGDLIFFLDEDRQVVVSLVRFAPLVDVPVFSHPGCAESLVYPRDEFDALYATRPRRPRRPGPAFVVPLDD